MEALALIFVLIAGLVFGSFLNVCIARLPQHQSIVYPGSQCLHCGTAIASYDNVPLLSFLLLRGRCRACRLPIAWRYPMIEFVLAALWLLCWLKFGATAKALGMAVETFILLGLAAMDAETLRLPDAFTLPGIMLGIVYSGAMCGRLRCALFSAGWAGAGAALLLLISGAYWLLRRRMGLGIGDAKLMAMIAAWLGPLQALLALFLGVLAAAIYGIAVTIAKRRFDRTLLLPFGAFLCAAALFATFQGEQLMAHYLALFR
ncbi:MAG TPA: prepilin peptidase [Silvibacterium sp.]|nr:prepilin peptidase [Silvibacterium sp.]